MRSVERIELPSTKQLMTFVRRSSESLFIDLNLQYPKCRPFVATVQEKMLNCGPVVATIWHLEVDMKTETVRLRVSRDEKRAFQDAADLAGIPLSSWIRERLRLAAIRELEGMGQQVPFIHRVPLRESSDG